jgi:four helix bundle protein
MQEVTRFEDLKCWQAARALTKIVYQITKQGLLAKDYELRDQSRSASISTMSNIAEGFGRFSDREFIRFLEMSQSSSQEVKSLSYVIEDQEYFAISQTKVLRDAAERSKSLTLGLVRYINQKKKP